MRSQPLSLMMFVRREVFRNTMIILVTSLFVATLIAVLNHRSSAERQIQVQSDSLAKAFRSEILAGDVRHSEIQMRSMLNLHPEEKVKFLDEQFKVVAVDDDQQWPHSSDTAIWLKLRFLTYLTPIFYDRNRKILAGYLGIQKYVSVDWFLLIQIFGSLIFAQFICIVLYRRSANRMGQTLTSQLTSINYSGEINNSKSIAEVAALQNVLFDLQANLASRGREGQLKKIVHDIRSPLSAMSIGIHSLKSEDKSVRDLLFLAYERMENIAKELLNEPEIKTSFLYTHDIDSSLNALLDEKRAVHAEKDIDFRVINNCLLDERLNVDLVAWLRAVSNIVDNAIESSKPRSVIQVKIFLENSLLHLYVRDSGPGISESVEHLIFRGEFTSKPLGNSLGVSSARNFAREHGGDLSFVRNPGCFEVRLTIGIGA